MAVAPLLVIVDDTDDYISYGPASVTWNVSTLVNWFNGTGHVPGFASNSSGGTISMEFEGTSVAFFGITPSVNNSQILAVSIDGGEPTNTSYNDPNPPSYRQWYQSPTLTEGPHQITLSNLSGPSLDFAVVTVGNNSPLEGHVIIVDNEDPSITFEGDWQLNSTLSHSTQFPEGLAFHNSTQDSSAIGANLTFRFTGKDLAIYGTYTDLGLLALTFTLDGDSLSKTYPVISTSPQSGQQQQNFQFTSFDFLEPGNHTLVVNITDCVNQTFSFDYLTFTPAFSTMATMPNLTSVTGATGASDSGSSHSAKLSSRTGAIIGVLVGLAVLLNCAFFARRRWKRNSRDSYIYPFRRPRQNVGIFPLDNRTSAVSNATTRYGLSSYSPLYFVDRDVPHGSSTTFNPTRHTQPINGGEEFPPSYDESLSTGINRPTVVR